MAETEAPGDKSGANHSVAHPCLFSKLFALDLAAILKADLGVLQEKQISRSAFGSLRCRHGLCAVKSQSLAPGGEGLGQVKKPESQTLHLLADEFIMGVDSEMQYNLEQQ